MNEFSNQFDKEYQLLFKNIKDSFRKQNTLDQENDFTTFLPIKKNFDLDSLSFDEEIKFNIPFQLNEDNSSSLNILKIQNDMNFLNEKENIYQDNNYLITTKRKKYSQKQGKIFIIRKIVKLGRKKKFSFGKGKHDKFQKDNLIRKFKAHFMNNILDFVNSCFLINYNGKRKNHIKIIKKLSSFKIKLISKEENLKWLDTKLKYILSQRITSKIHCENDFNIKLIKRIYEEGKEKKVINILEKTVREFWHIYKYGTTDQYYLGFKTLNDDVKFFRLKGESENYINLYKSICFEYETIFQNIIGRKKVKNKNA